MNIIFLFTTATVVAGNKTNECCALRALHWKYYLCNKQAIETRYKSRCICYLIKYSTNIISFIPSRFFRKLWSEDWLLSCRHRKYLSTVLEFQNNIHVMLLLKILGNWSVQLQVQLTLLFGHESSHLTGKSSVHDRSGLIQLRIKDRNDHFIGWVVMVVYPPLQRLG